MRRYANEQFDDDLQSEHGAARSRLFDWYLQTAHQASTLLSGHRWWNEPSHTGTTVNQIGTYQQALDWFITERASLTAVATCAASHGFDRHAWQLSANLYTFLDVQGHWADNLRIHQIALTAAEGNDTQRGRALITHNLGRIHTRLGNYTEAAHHQRQALALCQELGDELGQAHVYYALSVLYDNQDDHVAALTHAQHALRLFRAENDAAGVASALDQVGWDHAQLKCYDVARTYCEKALSLLRELGTRHREADTLDSLGYIEQHTGHPQKALEYYHQSMTIWRNLDEYYDRAKTLVRIGDTYRAIGNPADATTAWTEALEILDQLAHHDADNVRASLATLGITSAPLPELHDKQARRTSEWVHQPRPGHSSGN